MASDSTRPPSQLLGPEHDCPEPETISATYVICTSPRSGSNLLCDHLTATGVLGVPTEYLEMNVAGAYLADRWQVDNLQAYMQVLLKKRVTPNGVFANKIHWRQVTNLCNSIGRAPRRGQVTVEHGAAVMDLLFPGAALVYLRRGDYISQAVSLFKAFATGQWSSYMEQRGALPEYDFGLILGHYRSLIWEDLSWSKLFEVVGHEPVAVQYDDVRTDPQAVVERIAGHVGVTEDIPPVGSPTLKKQHGSWNRDVIERFTAELAGRGVDPADPSSVLSIAA